MPKLWNETIEAHRQAVHEAILEAGHALAVERGVASVTMSEVAARVGIGRATLYKYFPDVESILIARHQRHVAHHLERLERLRDQAPTPAARLEAVLTGFAFAAHQRRDHAGTEVSALVHRREHIAAAEAELASLITSMLAEAAAGGVVRTDVPSAELASFCMHALAAAAGLPDGAAVHRLVALTLAGLR
ncbi:TetR/AcrR family transcriptional regulator [Sinomonas sp. B1-1]|uniref:TetR/AcrR family transcriptional regulator n=1 Tax=Sinomonas sp. B1-1 TaxID=3141454 RepID=UPI003D28414D